MLADGKKIAAHIEEEIGDKLADKHVCFILFGENIASRQFIHMKSRVAERLGIEVKVLEYPDTVSTEEAVEIVSGVAKQNFDGIVIQLPLPEGLDTEIVLNSVPRELDIDVLGSKAKEDFKTGTSAKIPPVARAVMEILNFYNISFQDKEILIIGNGKLVGEPVANMLTLKNIPFNIIDKNTDAGEQMERIASADIIISGAGVPHMVVPHMVKDGAVLIDAGTSEQNGKLVGDIDPACESKASLMTPVPGGVGPVTVASLFLNVI